MTFEIDPTLVRAAIMRGRKLIVHVNPATGHKRVILGGISPHDRLAGEMRKGRRHDPRGRFFERKDG
jgi:hypothetical protein